MKPRILRSLSLACATLLIVVSQSSASVKVGDLIRFQNGPGSPGGEFGVALAATPTVTEMVTFCVEKDEFINFSSNFYVESITTYANEGGNGGGFNDPVDARSAWLYFNFVNETLANYVHGSITDNGAGRADSANALQNALWFIEEEQNSASVGQVYVDAANAEWNAYNNSSNYSGNMATAIAKVRIMNIRWDSSVGNLAQSQMFVVPEPASLVTWMAMALGGVVFMRRRK